MTAKIDGDGFEHIAESVRQLRRTLHSYQLGGRFSLAFDDTRTVEALRDLGKRARTSGLSTRDPAKRLDQRQLVEIAGVAFIAAAEQDASREMVADALDAVAQLRRPGMKKPALDALSRLENVALELAKYQRTV